MNLTGIKLLGMKSDFMALHLLQAALGRAPVQGEIVHLDETSGLVKESSWWRIASILIRIQSVEVEEVPEPKGE